MLSVKIIIILLLTGLIFFGNNPSLSAEPMSELDLRVSRFLNDPRNNWSDWNVPYEDGKILYDLVLKGNYKNILEIGTSTGHSTIWLAWAASKTGGRVTTIEIDQGRYEKALANFKKAGLSSLIQASLADAHKMVPVLRGSYDFIFCDADKDWYVQYFMLVRNKIAPGGCFAAHNVLWSHDPHIRQFLDHLQKDSDFRTTILKGSGEGISLSCRLK
jgi:caffeoyl-CoA O-methyltransferase